MSILQLGVLTGVELLVGGLVQAAAGPERDVLTYPTPPSWSLLVLDSLCQTTMHCPKPPFATHVPLHSIHFSRSAQARWLLAT
jgi:hypothetical protein